MNKRSTAHKAKASRPRDSRRRGDPSTLAPKFQRLTQAIAATLDARPSHEECEELLEFYVDCERSGENARARYPDVFKHLKACARCRISYDLLTDAFSQDADRDLTLTSESKIALPFLVPASPNAAWSRHVRPRIGGAPLGVEYTISPSIFVSALTPSPQFAMRGQSTTDRSLLLLDVIVLGSRNVQVGMWLHRTDNPDYARLEISLVSSSPLPEPLRAKLRVNDQLHDTPIQQGVGWIDPFPVSNLENTYINLQFEAGPPATSPEG